MQVLNKRVDTLCHMQSADEDWLLPWVTLLMTSFPGGCKPKQSISSCCNFFYTCYGTAYLGFNTDVQSNGRGLCWVREPSCLVVAVFQCLLVSQVSNIGRFARPCQDAAANISPSRSHCSLASPLSLRNRCKQS